MKMIPSIVLTYQGPDLSGSLFSLVAIVQYEGQLQSSENSGVFFLKAQNQCCGTEAAFLAGVDISIENLLKLLMLNNSVAEPEPVEPKLFETWSRNYIY